MSYISITSLTASSADIDAGTIDNATIGNTTRATGKFTIITTDDDNNEGNIIVGDGTSTVKVYWLRIIVGFCKSIAISLG